MPISIIDYEKVDHQSMALIMSLNSIQNQVAQSTCPGAARFISEIDLFRNNVACEIEKQGARE